MLRLLFVLISMFSSSALVGAVAVSSCILFATSLYALIFILNLCILYVICLWLVIAAVLCFVEL